MVNLGVSLCLFTFFYDAVTMNPNEDEDESQNVGYTVTQTMFQ